MAPADPWDARTVEWMTDSPPKPWNFDIVPTVHSIDEFWHRKYAEDPDSHRMRRIATAEEVLAHDPVDPASIHMPSPSWFPMFASLGLPIMAYGMIYKAYAGTVFGAIVLLGSLFAWTFEPSAAPHEDHDDHGHGPDGDGPDGHNSDGAAVDIDTVDTDTVDTDTVDIDTVGLAPVGASV